MAKRGKKYIAAAAKIDTKKFYAFNEGVELVKTLSTVKFDASIDLVIKLNLDTTKVEQQFRGNLTLPYFFGKVANVLVIDDTLTKETAKELGIKHFGGANMIADIKDG
jgi:large subunit ribosomal protein L1